MRLPAERSSLVRLPTQSSRRLVGPGGDFDAARRSNARSRVSRHSGGDQIISKSLTNPSPLLRGKSSYAVSSRCVGSADYAIRNGLSTRAVCAHTQHMACGVRRVDTADVHGHEWHHTCAHTPAQQLLEAHGRPIRRPARSKKGLDQHRGARAGDREQRAESLEVVGGHASLVNVPLPLRHPRLIRVPRRRRDRRLGALLQVAARQHARRALSVQ